MKKLAIASICLLLMLAFAACGGTSTPSGGTSTPDNPASAQLSKAEWVAYTTFPDSNFSAIALVKFADKVRAATDGRINMTIHTGAALGYTGGELLSVTRDNLVQVTEMSTGHVMGEEPFFEITTQPFMQKDIADGRILDELARDAYDKILADKWNMKLLYTLPWPMAGFWTQKEITSMADLKGIKMRTYDKNTALVVEAAGGTPYAMPFADVYSALATGAINSVMTSTPTAVDGRFWEVVDYYSPTNVCMTLGIVAMNLTEFNKLDSETQKIVMNIANEMSAEMWDVVGPALHEEMRQICFDNGIVETDVPQQLITDLYAATQGIRDDWYASATDEAKAIFDEYKKRVGL